MIPTLNQLARAGGDAVRLLEAVERNLVLSIDLAVSPRDRANLRAILLRLRKRRIEYLGDCAE